MRTLVNKNLVIGLLPNGEQKTVAPAWERILERDNLTTKDVSLAAREMARAYTRELGQATALRLREFQGRIRLAGPGELAPGEVWLCEATNQIVVPHEEAINRAWDSDGDLAQAMITFGPNGEQLVAVRKYPMTRAPYIAKRVYPAMPIWESYDGQYNVPAYTEEDLWSKQAAKAHGQVAIGVMTNYLNYREFFEAQFKVVEERLDAIMSDPDFRFDLLEVNGLKAARKDGNDHQEGTLEFPVPVVTDQFVTGSKRASLACAFIPTERNVEKLDTMSIAFQDKPAKVDLTAEGIDLELGPLVTSPDPVGSTIVERLITLGAIEVQEFAHDHFEDAKVLVIKCFSVDENGKKTPVGIETSHNQLTYTAVIPPVVIVENGTPRFINFLGVIERAFRKDYDPYVEAYGRSWPWTYRQLGFSNMLMVQKILAKLVGRYGYTLLEDSYVPDGTNTRIKTLSGKLSKSGLTVCYQTMKTENIIKQAKLIEDWLQAKYGVGFDFCGGKKGPTNEVRKHTVSKNGVPLYSHPGAHPRRSGQMKSQLTQSIPLHTMKNGTQQLVKSRVLIVKSGNASPGQMWATESGVEMQRIETAFQRNFSALPTEEHTQEIKTTSMSGTPTIKFAGQKKKLPECGKLITPEGLKHIVAPLGQEITAVDQNNKSHTIHYVLPMEELDDKAALHCYMENAVPVTVYWQGQDIEAWMAEVQFYRVISSAEMTLGGWKTTSTTGWERYVMLKTLRDNPAFEKAVVSRRASDEQIEHLENFRQEMIDLCKKWSITAQEVMNR
jgi:hypothetical protein